jgi:hypothetical protein
MCDRRPGLISLGLSQVNQTHTLEQKQENISEEKTEKILKDTVKGPGYRVCMPDENIFLLGI